MKIDMMEMHAEAERFCKQMQNRYSVALLERSFGELVTIPSSVSMGLLKAGFFAADLLEIRTWLMAGLKPFEDYPPTIENLVHIGNLLKAYPVTEYSEKLKSAWFKINVEYSQQYGKNWRGERRLDTLTKERVWMKKLEEIQATEVEIGEAMSRISSSGFFRTFSPTFEEFHDAILAIRAGGSPLVEEAWSFALQAQGAEGMHPLVRLARGRIGGHDMRVRGYDQAMEKRFKSAYKQLLLSPPEEIENQDDVVEEEPVYASAEEILRAMQG